MKCLLDTHTFLWVINDDKRLKQKHKAFIKDLGNEISLSFYSLMEISIKYSLGKLPEFKVSVAEIRAEIEKSDFAVIGFDFHHLEQYNELPFYAQHRDPFDKFIIACAIANDLSVLTYDKNFRLYKDIIKLID